MSAFKAMIIDDQKTMRSILRNMLAQINIKSVQEADDGSSALVKLGECGDDPPDIIICDLHMETMDGMEFVSHIRRGKTPLERDHPVIILTGNKDSLLAEVTEQAGATKVLHKPVSTGTLKMAIVHAVGYDFSR